MDQNSYKQEDNDNRLVTEVFCWGHDINGQFGLAGFEPGTTHVEPHSCDFGVKIDYLACGNSHTAFVSDGYIYTMGENADGRLGISKRGLKFSNSPTLVSALGKCVVSKVSCGLNHTAALTKMGEVFTWGCGSDGQLGLQNTLSQYTPQCVQLNTGDYYTMSGEYVLAHDISCGNNFTGVVAKNGDLFMFGKNDQSQIGISHSKSEPTPVRVRVNNEKFDKISCGNNHTLALTRTSKVYGFGANNQGQLGTGNKKVFNAPHRIQSLDGMQVNKICAGYHSACITFKGELLVWGTTILGEYLYPQRICKKNDNMIVDVKQGDNFTLFIDVRGQLFSFGNNAFGQLGVADTHHHSVIKIASTLKSKIVKTIACGSKHVMALGSDKPSFEFSNINFSHYRNTVYTGNQSMNQEQYSSNSQILGGAGGAPQQYQQPYYPQDQAHTPYLQGGGGSQQMQQQQNFQRGDNHHFTWGENPNANQKQHQQQQYNQIQQGGGGFPQNNNTGQPINPFYATFNQPIDDLSTLRGTENNYLSYMESARDAEFAGYQSNQQYASSGSNYPQAYNQVVGAGANPQYGYSGLMFNKGDGQQQQQRMDPNFATGISEANDQVKNRPSNDKDKSDADNSQNNDDTINLSQHSKASSGGDSSGGSGNKKASSKLTSAQRLKKKAEEAGYTESPSEQSKTSVNESESAKKSKLKLPLTKKQVQSKDFKDMLDKSLQNQSPLNRTPSDGSLASLQLESVGGTAATSTVKKIKSPSKQSSTGDEVGSEASSSTTKKKKKATGDKSESKKLDVIGAISERAGGEEDDQLPSARDGDKKSSTGTKTKKTTKKKTAADDETESLASTATDTKKKTTKLKDSKSGEKLPKAKPDEEETKTTTKKKKTKTTEDDDVSKESTTATSTKKKKTKMAEDDDAPKESSTVTSTKKKKTASISKSIDPNSPPDSIMKTSGLSSPVGEAAASLLKSPSGKKATTKTKKKTEGADQSESVASGTTGGEEAKKTKKTTKKKAVEDDAQSEVSTASKKVGKTGESSQATPVKKKKKTEGDEAEQGEGEVKKVKKVKKKTEEDQEESKETGTKKAKKSTKKTEDQGEDEHDESAPAEKSVKKTSGTKSSTKLKASADPNESIQSQGAQSSASTKKKATASSSTKKASSKKGESEASSVVGGEGIESSKTKKSTSTKKSTKKADEDNSVSEESAPKGGTTKKTKKTAASSDEPTATKKKKPTDKKESIAESHATQSSQLEDVLSKITDQSPQAIQQDGNSSPKFSINHSSPKADTQLPSSILHSQNLDNSGNDMLLQFGSSQGTKKAKSGTQKRESDTKVSPFEADEIESFRAPKKAEDGSETTKGDDQQRVETTESQKKSPFFSGGSATEVADRLGLGKNVGALGNYIRKSSTSQKKTPSLPHSQNESKEPSRKNSQVVREGRRGGPEEDFGASRSGSPGRKYFSNAHYMSGVQNTQDMAKHILHNQGRMDGSTSPMRRDSENDQIDGGANSQFSSNRGTLKFPQIGSATSQSNMLGANPIHSSLTQRNPSQRSLAYSQSSPKGLGGIGSGKPASETNLGDGEQPTRSGYKPLGGNQKGVAPGLKGLNNISNITASSQNTLINSARRDKSPNSTSANNTKSNTPRKISDNNESGVYTGLGGAQRQPAGSNAQSNYNQYKSLQSRVNNKSITGPGDMKQGGSNLTSPKSRGYQPSKKVGSDGGEKIGSGSNMPSGGGLKSQKTANFRQASNGTDYNQGSTAYGTINSYGTTTNNNTLKYPSGGGVGGVSGQAGSNSNLEAPFEPQMMMEGGYDGGAGEGYYDGGIQDASGYNPGMMNNAQPGHQRSGPGNKTRNNLASPHGGRKQLTGQNNLASPQSGPQSANRGNQPQSGAGSNRGGQQVGGPIQNRAGGNNNKHHPVNNNAYYFGQNIEMTPDMMMNPPQEYGSGSSLDMPEGSGNVPSAQQRTGSPQQQRFSNPNHPGGVSYSSQGSGSGGPFQGGPVYNQGGGNYPSGGGNYTQAGGNYPQGGGNYPHGGGNQQQHMNSQGFVPNILKQSQSSQQLPGRNQQQYGNPQQQGQIGQQRGYSRGPSIENDFQMGGVSPDGQPMMMMGGGGAGYPYSQSQQALRVGQRVPSATSGGVGRSPPQNTLTQQQLEMMENQYRAQGGVGPMPNPDYGNGMYGYQQQGGGIPQQGGPYRGSNTNSQGGRSTANPNTITFQGGDSFSGKFFGNPNRGSIPQQYVMQSPPTSLLPQDVQALKNAGMTEEQISTIEQQYVKNNGSLQSLTQLTEKAGENDEQTIGQQAAQILARSAHRQGRGSGGNGMQLDMDFVGQQPTSESQIISSVDRQQYLDGSGMGYYMDGDAPMNQSMRGSLRGSNPLEMAKQLNLDSINSMSSPYIPNNSGIINDIERLKKQNQGLEGQLDEKSKQIAELERKIKALEGSTLSTKDKEKKINKLLDQALTKDSEITEMRKELSSNKKSIDELIAENKHLKELYDKYGSDFLVKVNEDLRELTKTVLQLRYLDKDGPHTNKETKKKLEDKIKAMMEMLGMVGDNALDTTEREAIYKQASLYKKKEHKKKEESFEVSSDEEEEEKGLKDGPDVELNESSVGRKKLKLLFMRNPSNKGSSSNRGSATASPQIRSRSNSIMSSGEGKGVDSPLLNPNVRKSIFSNNDNLKKAVTSNLEFSRETSDPAKAGTVSNKTRDLFRKAITNSSQMGAAQQNKGFDSDELMGKLNKLAAESKKEEEGEKKKKGAKKDETGAEKKTGEEKPKKKKIAKSQTSLPAH